MLQARCDFLGGRTDIHDPAQPVVQIVLSPRMPYALQEWHRMAGAARAAGYRVAAFRDPRVPDEEWRDALVAAGLAELRDTPLLHPDAGEACQVLNHAPAAVVARCGKGHAWPVLGVMPTQAWLQVLAARRADLEALPCP